MNYIKILMVLCIVLSISPTKMRAQNTLGITVNSTITDQNGKPVANATIYGVEGEIITYSDSLGYITLVVPEGSTIIIKAKGHTTQQVKVLSTLNKITLVKNNSDQKVNVAFKTIEKEDLPGAISVINPQEYLDKNYLMSVQDGMYGRVGGLLWYNNIWGMNDALVMIDGVSRSFDDIKLSEVEQITVLKGVNAVALYGSYAAKGVILITTKRGEANNRKISVKVNKGIGLPKSYPKFIGSGEYMSLYNEARINDGLPALYDSAMVENYKTGNKYRYPNVDYYSSEYLKKFINTTDLVTEFSGGNEKASFYTNLGFLSNSSLLNIGEAKNNANNRVNVRGNIDLKINDFIKSSIDVSYVVYNNRSERSNYWGNASTLLPFKYAPLIPIDLLNPNDSLLLQTANISRNIIDGKYILGGTQENPTNPIGDAYAAGYNKFARRDFQITNGIDVDLKGLMKGLSFHTKMHLDFFNSYDQSINYLYATYSPTWVATADTISGLTKYGADDRPLKENISNTTGRRSLGFSFQLNYITTLNDVHNVSAILLGASNSISYNGVYQLSTNSNLGLQLGYNYKHKYWVDFSGAFVNSTKLPENNRTAFSPTLGLSWLISSENFLKGSNIVDRLKLSVSAGILNTDLGINDYYLYENVYRTQNWFGWRDGLANSTSQSFKSSNGINPNLTFVKRKEFNVSAEGSFLERLISLEATYFVMYMDGFPTRRFSQYPGYANDFVPWENYNSNKYSGFDVLLNLYKKVREVEFNLGVTATYADSKVTKRDELYADSYQNRADKPVDAIFGLVSSGFFTNAPDIANSPVQAFGEVKPGDIKYIDQNGDDIIDSKDEVEIGRWISPYSFGLNFTVSYKNFSVFMQGTGSIGGNGVKTSDYYWVDENNKYSEVVRDRWTQATSATAKFPRLSSLKNDNNFRYSDFWLYNTDRFDITQVQLTYNLPNKLFIKTFVKDLGVYVSGFNLYTFARNKEIMDMVLGGQPYFRYFNLGLRANF